MLKSRVVEILEHVRKGKQRGLVRQVTTVVAEMSHCVVIKYNKDVKSL